MSAPRSSRFSPHLVSADRLAELFVGRWPVVERLVEDTLAVAAAGGARYEVVVAPRGAGKSHLFALVAARLRERGEGVVIAQLAEEEYPASLVDLLARFLQVLPTVEGLPSPADHLGVLRRARRDEQLATAVALIETRVGEHPLVLLAENLDRIFDALGREGQQALRSILSAHPRWSFVATSCTYGPDFTDGRAPFYKMFAKVALPDLTDAQAVEMLRRLARAHGDDKLLAQLDGPGGDVRVRAIRFLVGDNPRAMALLFPFLRDGRLDDLEGVFLDLAEELTPYFQDQMSRIPAGQRPYLELLAGSWGPMTVGELADATFATPQTASGQLRYLKRDGLVTGMQVGREVYYELAEPLHRLAAAMKHPERAPLTLARFLVAWLPREHIEVGWEQAGKQDGDPWALALRLGEEPESGYEAAVVGEVKGLVSAGKTGEALKLAREGWDRTHGAVIGMALMALKARNSTAEAAEFAEELVQQCPGAGWKAVLSVALVLELELPEGLLATCQARLASVPEPALVGEMAALEVAFGRAAGARWDAAVSGLLRSPPEVPFPRVIPRLLENARFDAAVALADLWGFATIDEESFSALLPPLGDSGKVGHVFTALVEEVATGSGTADRAGHRAYRLTFHHVAFDRIRAARARLAESPASTSVQLLAGLLAYEAGDTEGAVRDLARIEVAVLGRNPLAVAAVAVAGGDWGLAHAVAATAAEPTRAAIQWCVDLAATGRADGPRPTFDHTLLLLHALATWVVDSDADDVALHNALEDLPAWGEFLTFAWLVRDARTIERGGALPPLRESKGRPLLQALWALPDDPTRYARLAAPERRTLRMVLRQAGAQKLLDALPAEGS